MQESALFLSCLSLDFKLAWYALMKAMPLRNTLVQIFGQCVADPVQVAHSDTSEASA